MAINLPTALTALPQAKPAAAPAAGTPDVAQPTTAVAGVATPTADENKVAATAGENSSVSLPSSESVSGSSTENAKVQGNSFSSIGDPHETTGDGLKFDNMKPGDFIKLQAKSGDFELQTRHEPWDKNPQAMVNTMAAIKVNGQGDKVVYDSKTDKLTFNGKPIEVKAGETFEIPGGGTIVKSEKGYDVSSAKGDKVSIMDRGNYCDVTGEVSPDRVDGDVSGALGRVDSDTDFRNDIVGRDGQALNSTDEMIDAWQTKAGESMFDAPAVGGALPEGEAAPVEGEAAPVEGAKPAEGEAAPIEGAAPIEAEGADDPITKLLGEIKKLLAELKGDPANAAHAPLFGKLEGLMGGAEKEEEPAKQELGQAVNEAKPEGNAQIERLLAMLKEWIEMIAQKDEARKAGAAEAEKAVAAAEAQVMAPPLLAAA